MTPSADKEYLTRVRNTNVTVWDAGAGLALFGILITGMWAEFDRLGPPAWILVSALLLSARVLLRFAGEPKVQFPEFGSDPVTRLVSLALLLPVGLVAVRTWTDDFPLSGDHDHHLLAIAAAARFWAKNWLAFLGFAGAIAYSIRRPTRSWWPFVVVASMVAVSFKPGVPIEFFARYPAAFYTLSVPFHLLGEAIGTLRIWKIDHVSNLLAPIVWLFLLRPWLFGRAATGGGIAAAAFVLFNREFLYFVDSVTLDVWPVVFTLVSIEALFHAEDRPWLAPLVAGVACIFRDAAVFVFLTVGLASAWRVRTAWRDLATVIAGGTLGIIPFFVYYLERRAVGVWRTMELVPWAEAFTSNRVRNFQFRTLDQIGPLGLMAAALAIGATLIYATRRGRTTLGCTVILLIGGMGQLLLVFSDRFLLPWPGYAHLTSLPMATLVGTLSLLPKRASVFWIAGLLAASQLPRLNSFLASLRGPSYARNFTEDYATPIFVPLRETLAKVRLKEGQTIRWIFDSDFELPWGLPVAYRDLWKQYRWETRGYDPDPGACRCEPEIALFIASPQPRNLMVAMPSAPYPAPLNRINRACLDEVERSCRCETTGHPVEARVCVQR